MIELFCLLWAGKIHSCPSSGLFDKTASLGFAVRAGEGETDDCRALERRDLVPDLPLILFLIPEKGGAWWFFSEPNSNQKLFRSSGVWLLLSVSEKDDFSSLASHLSSQTRFWLLRTAKSAVEDSHGRHVAFLSPTHVMSFLDIGADGSVRFWGEPAGLGAPSFPLESLSFWLGRSCPLYHRLAHQIPTLSPWRLFLESHQTCDAIYLYH